MPENRVIKDSDDSEDDFSDRAASVDPLQGCSTNPPLPNRNSTTQPSAIDFVYPTPSVSNDQYDNHNPPPKNGLKRGRTFGAVIDETHATNNDERKSLKRRRTATTQNVGHTWDPTDESKQLGDPWEIPDAGGPQDYNNADTVVPQVNQIHQGIEVGANNFHDESPQDPVNTVDHGTGDLFVSANGTTWAAIPSMQSGPLDPDDNGNNHPPNRTPARSKSLQVLSDSPHDTEPMSSISLARVRRRVTVSDIQPPQSSVHSIDELALPPSIEVAVPAHIPAGSGNDLTTNIRENEIDESDSDDLGGVSTEVYKPRPTRSRSNAVVEERVIEVDDSDDDIMSIQDEHREDPSHELQPEPESEPEQKEAEKELDATVNSNNSNINQTVLAQDGNSSVVAEQPGAISPSPLNPDPQNLFTTETPAKPKRTRKTGKKKIKRGKTTSAIVKKSVESDVEDDVIWLDERPSTPGVAASNQLPNDPDEEEYHAPNVETEPPVPETDPAHLATAAVPTVSAPKKRGRKRKKTTDDTTAALVDKLAPKTPEPERIEHPTSSKSPLTNHDQNTLLQTPDDSNIDQTNENPSQTSKPNSPSSPTHNDKTNQPQPVETPKKPTEKGPDKHSPITVKNKVSYRVGLSRKARIAPLLKMVRK